MIVRRYAGGGTESVAVYSDCEAYRYRLSRTWAADGRHVLFVMLNPSTADEVRNDPTVGRCEARARGAGFGTFTVCNLFGWRSTKPANLRDAADPVGPENDAVLTESAQAADAVICAWGVHGALQGRGQTVAAMLRRAGRPFLHFGLTKEGHPRHPLYLPKAAQAVPWLPEAGAERRE